LACHLRFQEFRAPGSVAGGPSGRVPEEERDRGRVNPDDLEDGPRPSPEPLSTDQPSSRKGGRRSDGASTTVRRTGGNVKYLIAITALVLFIGLPIQASAQVFEEMKQCDDLGPVAFETGPFKKFWGAAVAILFGEPKEVHLVRCVDDYAACYFMAKIKPPDGKNRKALDEDPDFVGMTKANPQGEFSCVPLAAASVPPASDGECQCECQCDCGGNGDGDHCCSKCPPGDCKGWDWKGCQH
jgi:hypothetical protein